jgi:GT2 family glycosyltransferase
VGARATTSAAVAVLTWRGEATTRVCLESLRILAEWPGDVVVVDNDSGTGEGQRLAEEFGVAHVTTDRNGGVAGGYNAAIEWACGRGYDRILLLNNDTRVDDPGVVERLSAALTEGVAAVGPTVKEADGRIWSAGGRLIGPLGHSTHAISPSGGAPYEVDWIDGSAMLVSLAAVRAVGGLSEDFFLYWEETDWCARARRAGLRIVVAPDAVVIHARGGTIPALTTREYALRNSLLFVRRNVRGWRAATAAAFWLFVRVPVFVVRVTRAHGLRAAAAGLRDAVGWHARSVRRQGWSLDADGPSTCPGPEDSRR